MPRTAIPTWSYALVVVRLGPRFLLVHEAKHGGGWYLPAGRVEPGETLAQAALRETLEESGVPVTLEGVLRLEHTPGSPTHDARVRAFFLAHPSDDTPVKRLPDEHSLEAAWVHLDDLGRYALRSEEVRSVLHHVARGGPVYPLSMLTDEGAPWG